jgi:hypothetical protein
MAKRKYNLSPAGRAVLVDNARRMNADPAAKAERIRRQMADPEFQRRREEGFKKLLERIRLGDHKPIGRVRKEQASPVADNVPADAITTSRLTARRVRKAATDERAARAT